MPAMTTRNDDGAPRLAAGTLADALREAAAHSPDRVLVVDGEVRCWIADRHPEQLPAKYGCSSWRQVVHECRLFELRYREVEGQRAAWYRPREA